jgi:hypothetical protein
VLLHDAEVRHLRTREEARIGFENTVLPNNDGVQSVESRASGDESANGQRRGRRERATERLREC